MKGEDLRFLLDSDPRAERLAEDNHEYLVSYRFDTGAEIAFDPRTTKKCSVFVEKLPVRMLPRLGKVDEYPPSNPSSALRRVSTHLAGLPKVYKVDIPDGIVASELLSWVRWA